MATLLRDRRPFWDRVNRDSLLDCWEWQGPKTPEGYGIASHSGRPMNAHRAAWILTNGEPPRGAVIRHDCENPPCCNPAHLRLGTHADNIADKVSRGRQARGEGNGRAVLHVEDVRAIRAAYGGGESIDSITARYPVTRRAIVYIVQRVNWKHVA